MIVTGSSALAYDAEVTLRARSVLFALGLLLITLIGHTAAQGALPDLVGLIVMSALALVTSSVVMARKRSNVTVFVYLLVGQFVLHLVATVTGSHGGHTAATSLIPMVVTHTLLALVLTLVAQHMDRIVAELRTLGQTLLGRHVVVRGITVTSPRAFPRTNTPLTSRARFSPHSRRGPPVSACA